MIKGTTASSGIVIGTAQLLKQYTFTLPDYKVEDIEGELRVFDDCLQKVIKDLEELMCSCEKEISSEYLDILEAQIVMVEDPSIKNYVIKQVNEFKQPAVVAFHDKCDYYIKKFETLDNEYIKERISDIIDMRNRVLGYLLNDKPLPFIPRENSIVVAIDVSPSFIISQNCSFIKGYMTEAGSPISHASIVARSLELPALIHAKGCTSLIKEHDVIVLNAREGYAKVNPSKEELKRYENIIEEELKKKEQLANLDIETRTKDDKVIELQANISSSFEIPSIVRNKAVGIGLFRSELMFMESTVFPTEEIQYNEYKKVLDLDFKQVTLRTLDIGGDKELSYYVTPYRGIDFSLHNVNRFKLQLRAMLKANTNDNLRIMIPVVTSIEQIVKTKEIINEIIDKNNIKSTYTFGVMIETTEILPLLNDVMQIVDFVSIGTNDLQAAVFNVDRFSLKESYELDPVFLNVLHTIITTASNNNTSISICGEMASSINGALVLVGLGAKILSMSPSRILYIKEELMKHNSTELQKVSNQLLRCESSNEVIEIINNYKNSI